MPDFLINTPQELFDLLADVRHSNCYAQLDVYHMARQGISTDQSLSVLGDRVAHVQFADYPGRTEPGSGELDFNAMFRALEKAGYQGAIAAEYRPSTTTTARLAWLQNAPFAQ